MQSLQALVNTLSIFPVTFKGTFWGSIESIWPDCAHQSLNPAPGLQAESPELPQAGCSAWPALFALLGKQHILSTQSWQSDDFLSHG